MSSLKAFHWYSFELDSQPRQLAVFHSFRPLTFYLPSDESFNLSLLTNKVYGTVLVL